ncbi:MAG: hypothetical protein JSV49_10325 [Thermoplasmata archaeon]|nr:MAG: hypothetical protein JSV49_10325 [Thermoplasmata archaeon]
MKPKSTGIQIIRKEKEEKPSPLSSFIVGFIVIGLVLCPLFIAGAILTRLWVRLGTTDFAGIYIGLGLVILVTFILSLIFMRLASR